MEEAHLVFLNDLLSQRDRLIDYLDKRSGGLPFGLVIQMLDQVVAILEPFALDVHFQIRENEPWGLHD